MFMILVSHIFRLSWTFSNLFITRPFQLWKQKGSIEIVFLGWLAGLKESIKRKNKLYRISLKHRTSYNITLYREYRNELNTLLKMEEKKYYQSLILANKNNLKKTWGIIKQVINKSKCSKLSSEFSHNGSILNDKKYIANAFNDYFVNIGPTLASKIPQLGIDYRNFMPNKIICPFLMPCWRIRSKENDFTIERRSTWQGWNNVQSNKMYLRSCSWRD